MINSKDTGNLDVQEHVLIKMMKIRVLEILEK